MIDLSLVKPCRTSEHKLHWFTGRVISFQVQTFLRGESGALLLIPCSLGPSESFQCDKIELGELLLRGGLNEGTELPGMLHILQENKDPSSLSPEGKRNTNCTWLYWELCKALKPPGSFPPSPSIIAFPIFSWISRFSQANSFQPFNISPMSEGRMALHGVAMETPAGYGMEMGERRKWSGGWKAKVQEPHQDSFLSRDPRFLWIYLHSSEVCVRTKECGTPQRWKKRTNVIPGNFLAPSKVTVWFSLWKSAPSLLDPFPFPRALWCSVQPEQGSFLVGCLGNMGCPERARATCSDFLGGSSAPSPVLGGIFWGGELT